MKLTRVTSTIDLTSNLMWSDIVLNYNTITNAVVTQLCIYIVLIICVTVYCHLLSGLYHTVNCIKRTHTFLPRPNYFNSLTMNIHPLVCIPPLQRPHCIWVATHFRRHCSKLIYPTVACLFCVIVFITLFLEVWTTKLIWSNIIWIWIWINTLYSPIQAYWQRFLVCASRSDLLKH